MIHVKTTYFNLFVQILIVIKSIMESISKDLLIDEGKEDLPY